MDEAKQTGLLESDVPGRVHISVDSKHRRVRIRDSGTGLEQRAFVERLVAFGASKKRGSRARGFRGVGRLAGLGYCQELIFRSRACGEPQVNELRWDCRQLKALLRDSHAVDNLEKLVCDVAATRRLKGADFPKHFFEVELIGIVRHGNDVLLDGFAIETYLSQVAPVPFAPEFRYGRQIESVIGSAVNLGNIQIYINENKSPIYRPHRNRFEAKKGVSDDFVDLQLVSIPGSTGEVAAIGWVLHHSYMGAFPVSSSIKGIRLRSGNMQVGEANLLDELFPEPRFNSWLVGEVHVIDPKIFPNGRRDHFEQNIHFRNVLGKLSPLARELSRRCRTSSIKRNWIRQFEQGIAFIKARRAILRQAAITSGKRETVKNEIVDRALKLERIASLSVLDVDTQSQCRKRLRRLNAHLSQFLASQSKNQKLRRFRRKERQLVQRLFDLIYDTSRSQDSARLQIEKILRRL